MEHGYRIIETTNQVSIHPFWAKWFSPRTGYILILNTWRKCSDRVYVRAVRTCGVWRTHSGLDALTDCATRAVVRDGPKVQLGSSGWWSCLTHKWLLVEYVIYIDRVICSDISVLYMRPCSIFGRGSNAVCDLADIVIKHSLNRSTPSLHSMIPAHGEKIVSRWRALHFSQIRADSPWFSRLKFILVGLHISPGRVYICLVWHTWYMVMQCMTMFMTCNLQMAHAKTDKPTECRSDRPILHDMLSKYHIA